jgi:hypothetical protein
MFRYIQMVAILSMLGPIGMSSTVPEPRVLPLTEQEHKANGYNIEECGHRLLASVGKTREESKKLPDLYIRNSKSDDREFLEHMFAVTYVES